MTPRFLQVHFLTAYPAALLNRDDAGMAKRMPFGGASRIRVSSQCLKRHWRRAEGDRSLKALSEETSVAMSVRSRSIFEKMIAAPLIAEGMEESKVRIVLKAIQAKLLGESAKKEKEEKEEKNKKGKKEDGEEAAKGSGTLETSQVIILGVPEIEFIKEAARKICAKATVEKAGKEAEAFLKDKETLKNLAALKRAAGLDAALFGRMVTSDILARGDAAIHVAHALSVHAEEAESDYFTAVDDLHAEAGELGSGHINESELTSGLFYGYVVVDLPQLLMNLEGVKRESWESTDRTLASRVVESLLHTIATVSPGAKLGSTAPYSCALLLLLEAGSRQPRTLANAFLSPVDPLRREGLVGGSIKALGEHLKAFDKMYGQHESRALAAMVDASPVPAENLGSLEQLTAWASAQVRGR